MSNPKGCTNRYRSEAIDALPSSAVQASTVLDSLLSDGNVCDYDAVVLVSQRGVRLCLPLPLTRRLTFRQLHASDLRSLSPSSTLSSLLKDSPSSRSFQYLSSSSPSAPLSERARTLATECSARLVSYAPGDSGVVLDSDRKHVISLTLSEVTSEFGAARRGEVKEQEENLAYELAALAQTFPNHLVVYTGVPVSTLRARAAASPAADKKKKHTGILHTYQILSPGLITVLLVVFFILVPVLLVGINALAGIQNMVKLEAPKGFDARERKNQ